MAGNIKFAHMSDCHIGSWSSHPDMMEFPMMAFDRAINDCISEKVDFIIIAGDLFDTSIPPIEAIRKATSTLRKCREAGIHVYTVPGSHDYSPTGKTMMSVLEEAGLLTDVCKYSLDGGIMKLKFTVDRKTGTKLTGIMGRKGSLDAGYYKILDKSIEEEEGFKIFLLHAGLEEEMPEIMKALSVSKKDLPKNFNYYASGHIHKRFVDKDMMIVFPGELFPTSFDELEDYSGSYVIAEVDYGNNINVKWRSAKLFDVASISINVTGMRTDEVEKQLSERVEELDMSGKVLLIKLSGVLESGRPSEINLQPILSAAKERGAIAVKRSMSALSTKEFKVMSAEFSSQSQIENKLIGEHADQLALPWIKDTKEFVRSMVSALSEEKNEDETNASFEDRLKANAKGVAGL
ncbi:DNA repair exonuclease [Candidatus Woesearchaeota archaeon]|nr:DNA repair exonuclease [Candidatus Woesearchaeota archaeon]